MFSLTGFPQVDTGIYVIMARAGVTRPDEVRPEHLDEIANFLEDLYSDGVGQSLAAGIVFTNNSGFAQISWNEPRFRHKRKAYANFVLRGHQSQDIEPILEALEKDEYRAMVLRGKDNAPRCAFTGQSAYLRVSREMLPMLNGRSVINFGRLGMGGLPVSALTLLAIHAMPLGCLISQGRLLAAESDDLELAFEFAKLNYQNNLKHLTTAQSAHWEKLPNQSAFKTSLIDGLMKISRLSKAEPRFKQRFPSLTAYHFSNNGLDPKIDVYALPSFVIDFLITADGGKYQTAWREIVNRAWQEDKPEAEEKEDSKPRLTRRNYVYEDIFGLPDNARRFLRTYFLRHPMGKIKKDVRSEYSWQHEADLISWELTDLFLGRMMNMEKSRIDNIRALGDRLATHIASRNDKRLLHNLYAARDYRAFRLALLPAIRNYKGGDPLVEFDRYVSIFEEGDEFARLDWNLARDLLLIRIFEQLHRAGQLDELSDALNDGDTPSDDETSA